jgi:cob(I)alamin adenosyltransferase
MKIYTKTGDTGDTGLPGGARIAKDAVVTEVFGTIDEFNTALGLARAAGLPEDVDLLLDGIQSQLFDAGAEVGRLGTVDLKGSSSAVRISAEQIDDLEKAIDRFEMELTPLRNFILPGGTPSAAMLHFARSVCRRAERRLVSLLRDQPGLSPNLLIYLNRLSDLLFVLARLANHRAGQAETIWKPSK